ncbi:hypothetical protein [Streptomyces sp. NPDC058664]|uniref:hypothetical protein n=1 Tax=unclassified Streptomyces TaxID=2593676 RepID=UPI0036607273
MPIGTAHPGAETLVVNEHLAPHGSGEPAQTAWYRTGGQVENHGDDLVHLGRLDSQIKINGYRVGLSEVTQALRSRSGVTDAVVVARIDRPTSVLQAVHTGDAPDPAPLLTALQERLPG